MRKVKNWLSLFSVLVLLIAWLIIAERALFDISLIDGIFYNVAANGLLDRALESRAAEAKRVQIITIDSNATERYHAKKKSVCVQMFLSLFFSFSMLAGWIVALFGRVGVGDKPFSIYEC